MVLLDVQTHELAMLFNFSDAAADLSSVILAGEWEKKLDSSDPEWLGTGTDLPSKVGVSTQPRLILRPRSFAVFQRTGFSSES